MTDPRSNTFVAQLDALSMAVRLRQVVLTVEVRQALARLNGSVAASGTHEALPGATPPEAA